MVYEVDNPAMLKVLLGAMQTMAWRAASSETIHQGVWRYPLYIRSLWISSDTTMIRCRLQISAKASSSSLFQTIPPGLWGLQRISIVVCSSIMVSRSSKSK